MKRAFYLLLALPLLVAACEPDKSDPQPQPKPEPEKEYAAELTLTSEAEMNFDAEGGEGVITYTAEMVEVTRTEPAVVEANCAATWVTDLTVAEDITFTVATNEAEARETKIVVTYWDKKFEVAVKQAAKLEEPEPPMTIHFEAKHLDGIYYGDMYSPGVANYYVWFSDLGLGQDYAPYAGGTYYRLDLYTDEFHAGFDRPTIPAGTYTLDLADTTTAGTLGYYHSLYFAYDEAGNMTTGYEGYRFSAAELLVDETGLMTLTATIEGHTHIVTFQGTSNIDDIYNYGDE